MKRFAIFWLTAGLTLCLGACRREPMATPTPQRTEPPAAEVTPTPTPELELDLEPWQGAYIQLLREDYQRERKKAREEEIGFSSNDIDYGLYDVDKDGIPELFVRSWGESRFFFDVYTCPQEEPLYLGVFYGGRLSSNLYSLPGENGILSEAVRADPIGETHWWRKFTLTDEKWEEIELLNELRSWKGNNDCAKPGDFAPGAELLEELTGLSDLQPILDYVPPLEPWQVAYWDILTNPGKYEGFYAVAEHIPSDNADNVSWYLEDPYTFAVEDINGDGIPELLLGLGIRYRSPQVLLNILRYNEKTGAVEDIDGPRTYPLMDNLWFSDTGYFSTINGAGGLYTEFWHLEDPDPEHYWYGYERTGQFNEEGELISVEEFPFRSSDGKEKFTLREYYDLLGESGIGVEWIELTEENIRQAFLVAGEP